MSEATALRVSDVLCVAIPVSDQDEALDFYVGVLGCEKYADEQVGDGFRWVEVRPHGSGVGIALLASEADSPAGVDTGIRLAVPDARATHAALTAAGLQVGELLLWEGAPPMFVFSDIDGNRLYIVEVAEPR
jgi:catechol 2,3-dioxygenase-like lactoylglutathione lyase family enzyme